MNTKTRIFRGMASVMAGLFVISAGAGSICELWKENIDQNIGTISSVIDTKDPSIEGTYSYKSDYSSSDELIDAHKSLNEQLSEEGSVLLKNDGTLPLGVGKSVTLFGANSHYPYTGGQIGASVEESEVVSLEAALEEKGFQVNPVMTQLYETLGNTVTGKEIKYTMMGTPEDENGSDVYGYKPGEIAANLFTGVALGGYRVGEPPVSAYEEADPDYADSFKDYSDAAIVVVGRTATEGADYQPGKDGLAEGESGTTALALNEEERGMIQLACDNFDKVVVLVNTVCQMEIDELKQNDKIDAILWVGFPGCYGFYGVADILNGETNPSGQLADTYAVDSTSAPAMKNYGYNEYTNPDGSAANVEIVEAEGIYVGYKYYETRYADLVTGEGNADSAVGSSTGDKWNYDDEVSYGFGYGLSYTTFDQKIDSVIFDNENHTCTVKATVTNTGDVAGKNAVQIYAQTPYTEYDKENLVEKSSVNLIDYMKSDILEPGESQTLETTFEMQYMASYDSNGAKTYIMDAGDYYLALGNGAHDALNNILALQGYSVKDGMDYDGNKDLVYTWHQDELDTTTYSVSSETGAEITNQLDNADLNYWQPDTVTYLSRQDWEGTWPETYDEITVTDNMHPYIDSDFYEVKTGEDTNDIFPEKDNNASFLNMKGKEFDDPGWDDLLDQLSLEEAVYGIRVGGTQPKDYDSVDMIVKAYESDGPAGYTYATLGERNTDENSDYYVSPDDPNYSYRLNDMVCETMVASTFNKDLAAAQGSLFGDDSLWMGVTIFFAPALNLHRTPYNARNIEYYSEDPMLSNYTAGKVIAAAREKGTLITAKHFAFNDQEAGRMGISVYMTEQKARETELRAFQGAIDNGCLSLMSSFVRIGVIYSSAHTGLMQEILRNEWGYEGFLMTDMLISQMANYMTVKESVMGGTTLMGISSDTLSGADGPWSYFTAEGVSGDAKLCQAIRNNTKYLLYAIANSNAMNGVNETSTVKDTMTWWRIAYRSAEGVTGLLTVLCMVGYVLTSRKKKKEA